MTSLTKARPRSLRAAIGRATVARLARVSAAALAGLAVGYLGVSLRVAESVTHVHRAPVGEAAPITNAPREEVSFRTADGLLLRGWLFRTAGERAVVFVHGKDSNRLEGHRLERLGDLLLANGYSVLAFDLRGHGESEGDRFSLGQYERRDVAAAIEFLGARGFRPERIALLGESMGAGTVVQAVAERPDAGPIIADSAYADGRTVIAEVGAQFTGLPSWFDPGIFLAARLFDLDVDQIRPAAVVRAHPERAFFFIHCRLDRTVPPHHSPDLAAASANPGTRLWMAPACGHVEAFDVYPSEYAERLLAFLAANMR